jgi:hypothetical protein
VHRGAVVHLGPGQGHHVQCMGAQGAPHSAHGASRVAGVASPPRPRLGARRFKTAGAVGAQAHHLSPHATPAVIPSMQDGREDVRARVRLVGTRAQRLKKGACDCIDTVTRHLLQPRTAAPRHNRHHALPAPLNK